jgi:folate-binding protein YgfZ
VIHYRPSIDCAVPFPLPPPQLIELAGADASAFAQAQFSSDVRSVPLHEWRWSAWLTPQGRVRALFRLLHLDAQRWLLVLGGGSAGELREQLARFVLRAKVELRVRTARAAGFFAAADVIAHCGDAPQRQALHVRDDGVVLACDGDEPRWLLLADADAAAFADQDDDALRRWRAADIRAGLVEIGPELRDRLLPAWIGLEGLGAVSIGKGCYPGQEIVARLHFKGGNKRFLHHVTLQGSLPPPGSVLTAGPSGEAGELVAAASDGGPVAIGLAVLPAVDAGASMAIQGMPGTTIAVISPVQRASV